MHKIHNYIAEVTKDSLKTDITNANYDACLNNGNADLSIIEQEVVYLLLLCEDTPTVKYFSVKSVKMADAAGIIESIETVQSIWYYVIHRWNARLKCRWSKCECWSS